MKNGKFFRGNIISNNSFLNKYDLISLIYLDKKFYKLCLSKLLSHSKIDISKYQEKIININNVIYFINIEIFRKRTFFEFSRIYS